MKQNKSILSFFVEKRDNNHEYIGNNPYNPTNEEIINKLHIKNHLDAYYSLEVKHKDVLGFE